MKSIKNIAVKINGLDQALPVTNDTSILDGDLGYISFADINFDKIPDLALTTSFGTPNLYLDYWVFDAQQKKYVLVGNILNLRLTKKVKLLAQKLKIMLKSMKVLSGIGIKMFSKKNRFSGKPNLMALLSSDPMTLPSTETQLVKKTFA